MQPSGMSHWNIYLSTLIHSTARIHTNFIELSPPSEWNEFADIRFSSDCASVCVYCLSVCLCTANRWIRQLGR